MKTLPIPPRELLSPGHDTNVPNGAGVIIAVAGSVLFWGIVAALVF